MISAPQEQDDIICKIETMKEHRVTIETLLRSKEVGDPSSCTVSGRQANTKYVLMYVYVYT